MKRINIFLITLGLMILLSASMVSAFGEIDGYIVKMPENTGISLMSAMPDDARYYDDGIYVVDTYEEALALQPYAEFIEPNHIVYLYGSYDYSTLTKNNYVLNAVNILPMWEKGIYGNDVLIGVLDTGINTFSRISDSVVEGHNFLGKTEEEEADLTDNVGHGTMISSIIATRFGETKVIGTAHHARIMPLKIFDGKTTNDAIVCQAINYAVENGCKLINMSLGSPDYSALMKRTIDEAAAQGVIFVSAVGNNAEGAEDISNINYDSYPATFENVIGVGAVGTDLKRASYSHHNGSVFVMAPGTGVKGIVTEGKTASGTGTSFAAPVVTGIIADMLSIDETLDVDGVKDILINTCNRDNGFAEGEQRNDYYGYGLIDAGAIVDYMLDGQDWFVSPIDSFLKFPEITVYKNNDYTYSPVAIMRKTNGKYKTTVLDFTDRDVITMKFSYDYNVPNFKLWKDMSSIMPLAKKR